MSDLRTSAVGSEGPVNGFKHVGNVMKFNEAVGSGESRRRKRQRGASFSIKRQGLDGGWLGAAMGGPVGALHNEWQMVGWLTSTGAWTAEWVSMEDSKLAWDVSATR